MAPRQELMGFLRIVTTTPDRLCDACESITNKSALKLVTQGRWWKATTDIGRSVSFALQALAQQFAVATDRLCLLPSPTFRRLFIAATQFHFTKHAFALHFLFQRLEGLIDIVVTNNYLHGPDRLR